jgi:hypothetical protein
MPAATCIAIRALAPPAVHSESRGEARMRAFLAGYWWLLLIVLVVAVLGTALGRARNRNPR